MLAGKGGYRGGAKKKKKAPLPQLSREEERRRLRLPRPQKFLDLF